MIVNAGLLIRPLVALVFLLGGLMLMRKSPSRTGAILVAIGAAIFLGGELYGLAVLKPFVGRSYDESWYEQIATVDAVATFGLLIAAVGLVAHAWRNPR